MLLTRKNYARLTSWFVSINIELNGEQLVNTWNQQGVVEGHIRRMSFVLEFDGIHQKARRS